MIDDCLTVEDLDQQSQSRAGNCPAYPQQISADLPQELRGRQRISRNMVAPGTQLPWLNMSSRQCHWRHQHFWDMTVEGTHHRGELDHLWCTGSMYTFVCRECRTALKFGEQSRGVLRQPPRVLEGNRQLKLLSESRGKILVVHFFKSQLAIPNLCYTKFLL